MCLQEFISIDEAFMSQKKSSTVNRLLDNCIIQPNTLLEKENELTEQKRGTNEAQNMLFCTSTVCI
jgi:hypothetical protein